MRAKKIIMPSLIAFLSLGFFSQSPMKENSIRRVSSVECVNCAKDMTSPVQLPGLLPFFVDANARQSENSFALFSRQIELQTQINNLSLMNGFTSLANMKGFFPRLPTYPSYALPQLANYQVNLAKPAVSQVFGGLTADPALKYLTQPGIDARTNPSVATGIGPKVLDVSAVLEANLGLAPSPNRVGSTDLLSVADGKPIAPKAAVAANELGGESVVPKTQDRITSAPLTSSLLGSRPIKKEPISPQVSFSVK